MKNEIEATFLSVNKELMRAKLKETGFILSIPEYIMRRKTFKFPNVPIGHSKWGRIRQESDKITMTIKDIRGSGISDVYESEIIVNDFNAGTAFFEACGITQNAFQENLREVWKHNEVEATIDTWPGLDPFIEVEGGNEDIVKKISEKLGFRFEEAVFGSIDLVYEKVLGIPSEEIINLPEITFKNPPKKNAT
jgi:adenylate cyclase class 2